MAAVIRNDLGSAQYYGAECLSKGANKGINHTRNIHEDEMSTTHINATKSLIQQMAEDPMLVLDRMAFQNGAVDLGLGFPNFKPEKKITEALSEAATGNDYMLHHYTRPYVILLEPFYTPYKDMLMIRGAVPVFVPLHPCLDGDKQSSADWVIDKAQLENAVTQRTKAIFLNNPMNPLGKVFDREELLDIANICIKHDLTCVADEVYQWLTYGGKHHMHIAKLPGMWQRTITLGSAGKTFNVTGWKVGWCLGPKHLIQVLQNYHFFCHSDQPQYTTSKKTQSINTEKSESEAVAVAFEKEMLILNTPDSYLHTFRKMAEEKRNKLCKYLNNAGFKAIVPEGCFYIIADITNAQGALMNKSENTDEALDYKFAKWAVVEKKLCVMPFSIFFSKQHRHLSEKYVRLCFVKTDETLKKAKDIFDQWNKN
ncbi:kynurenine--oxoglutarate transaminase 3-like [Pecten maximus]|uniref:kynurenine--oxoglutarate transaminase 3-like n=1 Tax=Pecten maximus TaxID=6579 RepID=UPI00145833E7|nr:kynurenine--oxoglutarate transaminase 3-like [Pecten maximus]